MSPANKLPPELVFMIADLLNDLDLIHFALSQWRLLVILKHYILKILDKSYDLVIILGNRFPKYQARLADLVLIRCSERYHDVGHRSLIHIAVQNGDARIVSMILLERPKYATWRDLWGLTPLHLASANGMNDTLCILLDSLNYQGVDAKDRDGNSALHFAARFGNIQCIDMLLKAGANINLADSFGRTPLMLSAERGFNTTKFLLKRGANLNLRDATESTALHHAVSCKTPIARVIKLLLNHGAYPLACLAGRRTPLHDAVARSSSEAVETLLPAVGDVNKRSDDDETILHFAAAHANDAIISLLLNYGTDAAVVSDLNRTPLHSANGRKGTMAYLIREGKLDITARDVFGKTAFETPSPMTLSDTFDTLRLAGLGNTQVLEILRTIEYFGREAEGLRRSKRRKV